jgi:hypothetical protein
MNHETLTLLVQRRARSLFMDVPAITRERLTVEQRLELMGICFAKAQRKMNFQDVKIMVQTNLHPIPTKWAKTIAASICDNQEKP